jgi:hypothetical protein
MNLKPLVIVALALLVTMGVFFWYITKTDGNPPDLYTNVQPLPPLQTPRVLPYIVWSPPAAGDHVVMVHPLVDRP